MASLINNLLVPPDTVSPAQIAAPYQYYTIRTVYTWHEGNKSIPVGGGPAAATAGNRVQAKIVRKHSPYGTKVVMVNAGRMGAMPLLPNPSPIEENEVLDEVIISPHCPGLGGDLATRMFEVFAIYTYHLLVPIWVATDGIFFPRMDADGRYWTDYPIGPNQFSYDLRGPDGWNASSGSTGSGSFPIPLPPGSEQTTLESSPFYFPDIPPTLTEPSESFISTGGSSTTLTSSGDLP